MNINTEMLFSEGKKLKEEAEKKREEENMLFFFFMIRRPPRSTPLTARNATDKTTPRATIAMLTTRWEVRRFARVRRRVVMASPAFRRS